MRALFVGLGSIGQRHLRNLKKLHPNIQCAAVRSGSGSRPVLDNNNNVLVDQNLALHYQVEEFADIEDAIINFCPTIIFITNPSSLHAQAAESALKSHAHIFVEKPIAASVAEVERLINIERSIGMRRVMVGFQYRIHPAVIWAKEILESGHLGKIISSRFVNGEYLPNWHPYESYEDGYAAREELGGGAILTQIHDLDCALNFFGMPQILLCLGGKLSDLNVNVEDSIQILMECRHSDNNFPVTISLDYLRSPPKREFEIVGDRGMITCNLNTLECLHSDIRSGNTHKKNILMPSRNDLFIKELEIFLNFSKGISAPTVDLEMALSSMKVAEAAKNSMKTKRLISL